jgi:Protein of unknown function (DUF3450)
MDEFLHTVFRQILFPSIRSEVGPAFTLSNMTVPLFRYVRRHWLLALLCSTPLCAEPPPLETLEKSAGDWLKVRAETSRLETEWSTQKQLLDSMAHAIAERAQTQEARRDFLRAKTARDRNDLAGMASANQAAEAGLQSADDQLKTLRAGLLELRHSLPPRLSAALELPYRSLASADLAVGDRMHLTMTIVDRCLQFNRNIVCEDEVLKLGPDGNARELEVIYWGLSHGYALDRQAGKVWFGAPGPEGWQWEPATDSADRIAQLIAIYRGKGEPEFIEVSAHVKNPSGPALKK